MMSFRAGANQPICKFLGGKVKASNKERVYMLVHPNRISKPLWMDWHSHNWGNCMGRALFAHVTLCRCRSKETNFDVLIGWEREGKYQEEEEELHFAVASKLSSTLTTANSGDVVIGLQQLQCHTIGPHHFDIKLGKVFSALNNKIM